MEGNKGIQKVQRTLLKQQYENFAGLSSEIMDQTFDRLQKLISQLEIQGEVITQEDINLKLLRSHKVTSQNPQMWLLCPPTALTAIAAQMKQITLLMELVLLYSIVILQSGDKLSKKMVFNCEMAMLTIRVRRFIKRIRTRKWDVRVKRAPRNQENKGREINRTMTVETPTENALVAQVGLKACELAEKKPLENQEYNKSKSDNGYMHFLPKIYWEVLFPTNLYLTFMEEIVKSEKLRFTTVVTPNLVEPKTVRKNSFRPPVIEDWNSDDDSEASFDAKNLRRDFLIGDNGQTGFFDVDSLTIFMNYVSVGAGNQTNGIAGTRDNIVTDAEEKPTEMNKSGASNKDMEDNQATRSEFERLLQQEKQTVHHNNTNSIDTISTPVSAAGPSFTNDDPSSPVNAAKASNAFFKNAFTLLLISNDLALYDNESWNDPRDFAKPVKAIALPQDVPSTSDRRLIELENQVQRLMEAHLALTQPTQVNKITTPCEICSGPHDTQYCMENPEQAFVEYASSRTDEAESKWYTFKPEQNNLGDTYNPSWRSHPNLRWRQPQNSQNNFSNPPNRFQPNGSTPNRPFNNRPQNFNNQSNIEGLVSEFMESQDARLSKFEADFKRQQGEMTSKIDIVLKAITDQIAGTLPSDTVKNPKLGTHPVSSARSYLTMDSQCSTQIHISINAITIHHNQTEESQADEPDVRKLNSMLESLGLVPQSSNTKFVCSKDDDGEVMFIEIIRDNYEPHDEGPNEGEGATTGEPIVEHFDTFLTRDELTYHRKLDPREDANGGISNFTGRIKGMHVFIGNFTYVVDFMIVEDISSIIDPRLSQVVLGRPFVEISNMTHDPPEGVVRFIKGTDEVAYKMPHKIEQYDSLSDLEKEHTKSVYLRNEEDKRRGVEYVMSKIIGFYKECIELGPEYLTGVDDDGEVTLYLMRRSLEVLRKFHLMILGERFNQLSHVSSPLLSKPGEY
ncbi:hypothetical protein Tco_1029363 [Tanacetum coccineum]|uniref:MAK10-like protein n=1 Tax=Tanacetum coccineum TaxID=301880 RepID=A0ABQ5G4Z8_9ASTR